MTVAVVAAVVGVGTRISAHAPGASDVARTPARVGSRSGIVAAAVVAADVATSAADARASAAAVATREEAASAAAFAGGSFKLDNRSGYVTSDLRRIIGRGLRATGTPSRGLRVTVMSAPERSRGCATVGGKDLIIAIASPSRSSWRRLGRLIVHEVEHLKGYDHGDMPRDVLYSLGSTPEWLRGEVLRYRGRAPDQLPILAKGRS